MGIYLDPFDPEVIKQAKLNGIADSTITAAQQSPVYKFVKVWKLALPLHPELQSVFFLCGTWSDIPFTRNRDASSAYHTEQRTSPPRRLLRDSWSVMIPFDVERMDTPIPLRTFLIS